MKVPEVRVRLVLNGIDLEKAFEILVDQIHALNNRRFLEKLGKLSSKKALELREKLGAGMDLVFLFLQNNENFSLSVNNSSAIIDFTEFPFSLSSGLQTAMLNLWGMTEATPPPTPLFPGSPTRNANSPASS